MNLQGDLEAPDLETSTMEIQQALGALTTPTASPSSGGTVATVNSAPGPSIVFTSTIGLGFAGDPSGTVTVSLTAATFRTALGLGTMSLKNVAANVANLGLVASAAYVQAEVQSIADKLDALLTSLRAAGHIA